MNNPNNKDREKVEGLLLKKSYLFYGHDTLAANAVGQITFAIDSTYDYIATGWSYYATGLFNVQFYENERKIFYDWTICALFNGIYGGMPATGNRHFNTFKPGGYLFRAKSNIVINIQDISADENTIKIAVDGFRVYREAVI